MSRRQPLGRHDSALGGAQTAATDLPTRVLFVGIDRDRFILVRDRLNRSTRTRFEIAWLSSAAEVLRRLNDSNADVVLIDDSIGADRSVRLIREATQLHNSVPPVILVTAHQEPATDRAAMEAGATDYLEWRELTADSLQWTMRHARRHREVLDAARRSASWFRALVDHGIDGVATLDARGHLTYVSPSVRRLLGFEDSALLGRHFGGLVHPDDEAGAADVFRRAMQQPGVPVRSKVRVRHANGGWRVQDGSTVNLLDEPAIQAIVCHFSDITEHESTQQALDESQELFRATFAEASDAILISDDDARFVLANRAAGNLFGMPPEELLGRTGREVTPDSLDHAKEWKAFLANGRMSGAHQIHRQDGTFRDVEFEAVANVLPGRHLSILRDVTERKLAGEALQRMVAKLRGLFSSNVINISFSDKSGRILEANDAFLNMVGRSRAELEAGSLRWPLLTPPEFIDQNDRSLLEARWQGQALPFEKQYVRPDGSRVWVLLSLARLPGTDGETVALSIDITRQKEVEHALVESERKFSTIFANSPLAIYIAEMASGRIVETNPAFSVLTGYTREEILGRSATDLGLWHDADIPVALIRELEAGRSVRNLDHRFISRAGDQRHGLISMDRLQTIGDRTDLFVAIITDVTDRDILEEEFRQAQKMEAVGRLAGGIAHDFNNLLTAILGYAELLADNEGLAADVKDDVENIRTAAVSAAGLTRQLLAFSRRQVLQPRILSLNEVVMRVEAILRRVLGEDIDLTVDLEPHLANVHGDTVQLEQILMNLAVNSRDAMPLGGKLSIHTRNVALDEHYVAAHRDANIGAHVLLSISDTGTGMDENVRGHIFEPFFTTKAQGKGTGLGLATVYGAIKQMGGSIAVDSELHHGTMFRIYLPIAEGESAAAEERVSHAGSPDGQEKVLLVEDKDEVRRIASRTLQRHGYRVTEAASPREALQIASAPGTRFDLLVTDVVMPEMRGRELAHHLRERIPRLRVVYMSGYTDDAIARQGALEPGAVFLQKPFTPNLLLQYVRQALDAPTPPPL